MREPADKTSIHGSKFTLVLCHLDNDAQVRNEVGRRTKKLANRLEKAQMLERYLTKRIIR